MWSRSMFDRGASPDALRLLSSSSICLYTPTFTTGSRAAACPLSTPPKPAARADFLGGDLDLDELDEDLARLSDGIAGNLAKRDEASSERRGGASSKAA
mmetsp:Transcript_20685/g.54805  ORF Transcript_20685/g.54805 Transcript_20685/m.54805 type:complete len:99 (+) Transcript_20685:447-743(+)